MGRRSGRVEAHVRRRVAPAQTGHLLQADHRERDARLTAGSLWRVDGERCLVES